MIENIFVTSGLQLGFRWRPSITHQAQRHCKHNPNEVLFNYLYIVNQISMQKTFMTQSNSQLSLLIEPMNEWVSVLCFKYNKPFSGMYLGIYLCIVATSIINWGVTTMTDDYTNITWILVNWKCRLAGFDWWFLVAWILHPNTYGFKKFAFDSYFTVVSGKFSFFFW